MLRPRSRPPVPSAGRGRQKGPRQRRNFTRPPRPPSFRERGKEGSGDSGRTCSLGTFEKVRGTEGTGGTARELCLLRRRFRASPPCPEKGCQRGDGQRAPSCAVRPPIVYRSHISARAPARSCREPGRLPPGARRPALHRPVPPLCAERKSSARKSETRCACPLPQDQIPRASQVLPARKNLCGAAARSVSIAARNPHRAALSEDMKT